MLIYKKNLREMLGNHMFYNGLGAIHDFGLRRPNHMKSPRVCRILEAGGGGEWSLLRLIHRIDIHVSCVSFHSLEDRPRAFFQESAAGFNR